MKKIILSIACMFSITAYLAQTKTINFSGSPSIIHIPDNGSGAYKSITQSNLTTANVTTGKGQLFVSDSNGATAGEDFAIQSTGGNPEAYLGRVNTTGIQFAKGLTYVYNNSNNAVTGTINLAFDYIYTTGGGRTADRIAYRVWGIEDTSENNGINGELRLTGGSGATGDNDATNYIGANTDGTLLASNLALGIADTFTTVTIPVDVTGYEFIVISIGHAFGTTADTDNPELIFGLDNFVVPQDNTTWTGDIDTDWATAGNWDNGIPSILKSAIIPNVANAPIISGSTNASVIDLTIIEPDGLTINSGGSLIVNGTSTGNVTYNRNLGTNNWYLVSSPVSGQTYNDAYVTANGIASGTGNNRGIASYTTASNTWSYLQSAGSGTFNNGQGYSVKRSSTGDVSFSGTINTENVSVAVSNAGTGFNLIGNPFTSHINSASFLGDNSANLVSQTLWVWNQATSNYDTYVTGDSFVLAPTQGFFVRSSNGTNLNIAESYQASTGGTFQKTSKTEITLTMTDGSANRFAKMYYLDNVTKGFDNGFDGETFGGIENSVDIFTNLLENNDGKKFQVQSLPIAEMETMIVPVGIKAAAGKEITFTAEAMNLPNDLKVFLEDRLTNTFTRLDEANSSYKVTLNDALNGTGRFYLHTKASGVLSTDEVVLQNTSIYAINKNTLRVVGLPSGNANVKMYNILGKQVMQTSFSSTGVKEISLPKLATGMYIIQLETVNGKLNKKIVLE